MGRTVETPLPEAGVARFGLALKLLRRSQFPRVRDLPGMRRTNLIRHQCQYSNRIAVQGSKLHFVTFFPAMDQHRGADVTGAEAVLREIARENYIVQFFDHNRFLFRNG